MSEHFTARLYEPTQAHGALRQAWEQYIKPLLSRTGAPPMVLEVRHSCVKHARQIEGVMRMLGAHTHAVKAPDGVECANCINEAKAKGEPHA